jgi:hypothetical protein
LALLASKLLVSGAIDFAHFLPANARFSRCLLGGIDHSANDFTVGVSRNAYASVAVLNHLHADSFSSHEPDPVRKSPDIVADQGMISAVFLLSPSSYGT